MFVTSKVAFTRVSTKGQKDVLQSQRNYHRGQNHRKVIEIIGSAWSNNPVIAYLKKKFSKNNHTIQADCFAFDRFSRNVEHCEEFRDWLKDNKYGFVLIVNGRRYNYMKDRDYFIIREKIKDGQLESDIKSQRAKRVWAERKKRAAEIAVREQLNPAEKYFVGQIIHTTNDDGSHISARNLAAMLVSCGVKNINAASINKWRRELPIPDPEEEVNWMICPDCDLCFAVSENVRDFTWRVYQRFIPSVIVAENLADTYDFLNGVCRKETLPAYRGLDSMGNLVDIINEIDDDEDVDSLSEDESYQADDESAAPAKDIMKDLQKLIIWKEKGLISDKDFQQLKSILLR